MSLRVFCIFLLGFIFLTSCASEKKDNDETNQENTPDEFDWETLEALVSKDGLKGLKTTNLTYEEALIISEKKGTPILFYFTGHACVNCRRMEEGVFSDIEIAILMSNEFLLVPLYVDDFTEIEPYSVDPNNCLGKEKVKTIGERNQLTECTFDEYQPLLVGLDSDGQMLGKIPFLRQKEEVKQELIRMLKKVK